MMKTIFTSLFALSLAATAEPPVPGDTAEDVTFSLGSDFSGSNFGTLTESRLSDYSGRVILIAYYTPW
jgi:hypothetical protein